MIKPIITHHGLFSALGNLDQTWQALMNKETGLAPFAHPDLTTWVGEVKELHAPLGTAQRVQQLLDLGLQDLPLEAIDPTTHLILSTTKGAIDDLGKHEAQLQSWQIATHLKKQLKLDGEATTVSGACASGTIGIIQATQKICTGEAESVLVVGIDILSLFVLAGFGQLLALAPNGCTPFDIDRSGLSLGEGMGYMLICHPDHAPQHHARIAGWGVSGDAGHITAPCRKGSGLIRVFAQTTNKGQQQVGAINGHGTGTIYNDAMEITAMNSFFKSPPPFHSVKGGIGHCLGAAGVMEACLSLKSLQHNSIPPTVGLTTVDERTKMATGKMEQTLSHPTILSCNSGFGGINAGVLLGRDKG